MEEQRFWEIIHQTMPSYDRDDSAAEHISRLTEMLREFKDDEIVSFGDHYERQIEKLCSWEIWAAAWLIPDINGDPYCGDGDFLDFLDRLVCRGQDVCKIAAVNPDFIISELKVPEQLKSGNCMSFVAKDILKERHGQETFELLWDKVDLAKTTNPRGVRWEEDETSYFLRVLPKCVKRWGIPQH